MKPTEVVIPATDIATDQYRLAQSKASVEREGLKPAFKGAKLGGVFKRGLKLDPLKCLLTESMDGWVPPSTRNIKEIMELTARDLARIEKEFSSSGLAATIALTDTAAGVREVVTYDENEVIVKPIIEHEHKWEMEGSAGEYWYECSCGATKSWPIIEGGSDEGSK